MLHINLQALAENWRLLDRRSGSAECAAVVKADAYGVGIDQAVPTLWHAGARTFFVATLLEASRVRAAAPKAVVYVLNALLPGEADEYAIRSVRPVLGSLDEVRIWADYCRAAERSFPAAIHIDTGMHRLGMPLDEARRLAEQQHDDLASFTPALLISHFVSSERADDPLNDKQIADFATARTLFPKLRASMANSSGHFLTQAPFYDLTRPGYALYGGNPTPGVANPMNRVVSLDVPVLQVRQISKGERVGYNGTWSAPGPARIATLALGYADGFPRSAGAGDGMRASDLAVAGRRCPVVGRVSMDLTTLDVTELPEDAVVPGTRVEVLGDHIDLDALAGQAGTNGYELLTRLGRRFRRHYQASFPAGPGSV